MKTTLLFLSVLLSASLFGQQKTAVKLNPTTDCKSYLNRWTYPGEVYSKEITVVSNLLTDIKLCFAFKDHTPMIYFNLGEYVFGRYNMDSISISFDDIDYQFDRIMDFQEFKKTKVLDEPENIYSLGFILTNQLVSLFENAEMFSVNLVIKSIGVKKSWDKKALFQTKEILRCFQSHYKPVESEYVSNLKVFENNFRQAKWGMSKKEVLALEEKFADEIISKDNSIIIPSVTLNADKFKTYYEFVDDKLFKGFYFSDEEFVNENNYYNHYKSLVRLLSKKYGPPYSVKKRRKGDLFDTYGEIGSAIETGYYTEHTYWETKSSIIRITITGENFETTLGIIYTSKDKEMEKRFNNKELKESLDGF